MQPVMQTEFGEPLGNCWQACIASVLEIPLSEVPPPQEDWADTWNTVWTWLAARGIGIFVADLSEDYDWPAGIYIVTGKADRGFGHAVVYESGQLVHDPHPDGTGLTDPALIELFYLLNPATSLI